MWFMYIPVYPVKEVQTWRICLILWNQIFLGENQAVLKFKFAKKAYLKPQEKIMPKHQHHSLTGISQKKLDYLMLILPFYMASCTRRRIMKKKNSNGRESRKWILKKLFLHKSIRRIRLYFIFPCSSPYFRFFITPSVFRFQM